MIAEACPSEWAPFFGGLWTGAIGVSMVIALKWNERIEVFFTRNPALKAAIRRQRRIDLRTAELIDMGLSADDAIRMAEKELRQEYSELQQALEA